MSEYHGGPNPPQFPSNPQQPFRLDQNVNTDSPLQHPPVQPKPPKKPKHTGRTILIVAVSVFATIGAVIAVLVAVAVGSAGTAGHPSATTPVGSNASPANATPTADPDACREAMRADYQGGYVGTEPPSMKTTVCAGLDSATLLDLKFDAAIQAGSETSETPEPTVTDPEAIAFGTANTWEDGLSATVSAPKTYRPADYAAGTEGFKHFVVFTVTIINKTGKAFDPSLATSSVQSGDTEGSAIFDDNVGGSPDTKVLNGRQTKFKVAYGVADPKDVVFEFAPSFEHNSAIWTTVPR